MVSRIRFSHVICIMVLHLLIESKCGQGQDYRDLAIAQANVKRYVYSQAAGGRGSGGGGDGGGYEPFEIMPPSRPLPYDRLLETMLDVFGKNRRSYLEEY